QRKAAEERQKAQQLTTDLSSARRELEVAQGVLAGTPAKLEAIQTDLASARADAAAKGSELSHLRERLTSVESQLTAERDAADAMRRERIEQAEQSALTAARASVLEQELDRARAELGRLNTVLSERDGAASEQAAALQR